ncbi:ABC transporter substrate-binding protein [soil metagenome]
MVVALLAAVLLMGLASCGDGGAEPGASQEATVVLDFTPNAVHAGIYAAQAKGYFAKQGIDLTIQQPGATSDAPKLLAAGKADFAVMDINDLAIAREKGADLVAIAPLVDRPLAAVIVNNDAPRDLEGATVGVTGVPSDDAVLDTVLDGLGTPPRAVKRVTIGFTAVGSLAAGKVDAATAFRNAEGVELKQKGVPVRTLAVERYGAPAYPELVVVTAASTISSDPSLVRGTTIAIRHGGRLASSDPGQGLDALLAANPSLDRGSQKAQLETVARSEGASFDFSTLRRWSAWASRHGITRRLTDVGRAFEPGEDLSAGDQLYGN